MSKIHPPLPKDDAITIEKAIQKIRFDDVENLYFFKNGKQKRRFRGTFNRVSIENKYLFEIKDASLVHNHPSGSSYSIEDIQSIVIYDAHELYLVTNDYLFHVIKPSDGWSIDFNDTLTSERLEVASFLAKDLIDKLISKNELALFEKDKEFLHYIWKIFFNFYEIKYQKSAL